MKKPKPFATEADLCAAFLAWMKQHHPTLKAYAEWAGWDILVVYPEGWQLGIQAKLRLNAEVIGQAAPSEWGVETTGPDYRAVLVPDRRDGFVQIAKSLGVVVFSASRHYATFAKVEQIYRFEAELYDGYPHPNKPPRDWIDWNPKARHKLPPCDTDAVAGSPCPVSLTPWKLHALDVLAELAVKGTITTRGIKALGIDPRRWISCEWLLPAGERGVWKRGGACPRFDEQHPTAYVLALEKARQGEAGEASA